MFFLIAYFLAPVISMIVVVCVQNKTENIVTLLKEKPRDFFVAFAKFFLIDNIMLLGIVTILRGSVNITESLRNGSRFMTIYLILSVIIGVASVYGSDYCRQLALDHRIIIDYGKNSICGSRIERFWSIIAVIIAIIGIVITLLQCLDNNFWGDEAFSITHVRLSKTFLEVAKCDHSHPPFFQLMLKLFMTVFGDHYVVYHLTSATAAIILLLFSMIIVRKRFSAGASCVFSLLMIMTGIGRSYALEVRQYEWACLFVVFCLYEGYMLLNTMGGQWRHWILFCLCGLGAAYTHYFAFAGVIIIYLMVFLRLVIADRKNMTRCLGAIVVSICGYLPWLMIFVREVITTTSNGFWISGVTPVKDGFIYIFADEKILKIFVLLLLGSVIWIYGLLNVYLSGESKQKLNIALFRGRVFDDSITWIAITATFAAYCIFIFEIFYGSILTPIFTARYVYPVAVALWLVLAILPMNISNPRLRWVTYVLVVIVIVHTLWAPFTTGIFSYFQANKTTNEAVKQINSYIEDGNTVILTDISHLQGTVLGYYFPGQRIEAANIDARMDYTRNKKNVLILSSAELDEERQKKWRRKLYGDVEFVSNTSLAGYNYYLYDIELWERNHAK